MVGQDLCSCLCGMYLPGVDQFYGDRSGVACGVEM